MLKNFINFFEESIYNNDLLRGLLIVFAITYVLSSFSWKDARGIVLFFVKYVCWTALYFLVWAIVHSAIMTYATKNWLFVSEVVRVTVFYVFYTTFFCKFKVKTKIILSSSLLAIVLCTDNFSNSILKLTNYPSIAPLFSIFYTVILIFVFILRRYSIENIVDYPVGAFVLLVTVNAVIFVFTVVTAAFSYFEERAVVYRIILFLMQCVLIFPAYFSMLLVCKERDKFLEERVKNQRMEALERQVTLARDNLEVVRNIRHDQKNQYAYMSVLMGRKEYDKVETMLREMSFTSTLDNGIIDCGNFEISAILSLENSKAKSDGVKLDYHVKVPGDLSFSGSDLCSILTNLIDNAIEANVRYGVSEPISVNISWAEELIYIKVSNRLPDDVDKKNLLLLKTSKANRNEHGIGTGIIRRIAEKNDGSVNFAIESGYFIAEVVMTVPFSILTGKEDDVL